MLFDGTDPVTLSPDTPEAGLLESLRVAMAAGEVCVDADNDPVIVFPTTGRGTFSSHGWDELTIDQRLAAARVWAKAAAKLVAKPPEEAACPSSPPSS